MSSSSERAPWSVTETVMSRGGGRLVSVDGLGGRARERRRTRFVTAARQDRLSRETRTQNYDVLVGSEEVSIRLAGTRGYRTPGRTASRTSRTRVARKGRRLSGTARPHRASAGTPSRRRAGACDGRRNETTTRVAAQSFKRLALSQRNQDFREPSPTRAVFRVSQTDRARPCCRSRRWRSR